MKAALRVRLGLAAGLLAAATACSPGQLPAPAPGGAPAPPPALFPPQPLQAGLPLLFIPNRGQTDSRVAYYAQASNAALYFTPAGLTLSLPLPPAGVAQAAPQPGPAQPPDTISTPNPQPRPRWTVQVDFAGAQPVAPPAGLDEAQTIVSYFKGPRAQWLTGLPTYHRLLYPAVWPGIDVLYDGASGRLKYDFVVRPGADPRAISLAYRGVTRLAPTPDGQLSIQTPAGELREERPWAYQDVGGARAPVTAAYEVTGPDSAGEFTVGFALGPYDASLPLIIDPATLLYSGFVGGAGDDIGYDIAVDSAGNVYLTGWTSSLESSFPVLAGPDLTQNGDYDVFITKVAAGGASLVYAGYIGGSALDEAHGVAVDGNGNAYITGLTMSADGTFPVTAGPGLIYNGGEGDAFVARVNAAGTGLVYSGFVGGIKFDNAFDIAADSVGNAYITGFTASAESSFPAIGGPDLTFNSETDAFVAKIDAAGDLAYAGYIGGSAYDRGYGITVDGDGYAYVTGETSSFEDTFPVLGGPDLVHDGWDAFIAKIDPDGSGFVFSGYLGDFGEDTGFAVTLDQNRNVYITGYVWGWQSATFPAPAGPDSTYNGGDIDGFVAKVLADGSALAYGGYIGGDDWDTGRSIVVDASGQAYISGATASSESTFPLLNGMDMTYNGDGDIYLLQLSADGNTLLYSTYFGGSGLESGFGLRLNGTRLYLGAYTWSGDGTFPTAYGPDTSYNGGDRDGFVAMFGLPQLVYLPFVAHD